MPVARSMTWTVARHVEHDAIMRAKAHRHFEHVDQIGMAGNRKFDLHIAEFAEFERKIEPRRTTAGEFGKARRIEAAAEGEGLRHVHNALYGRRRRPGGIAH